MLLLIEKAIMRFNIIFGNKRPLPYIRWISSSYVKFRWAFRIFPVTDCLKFRHLISLRCPLIDRLRFPFENAFSLLLFIDNFLNLSSWIHYILVLYSFVANCINIPMSTVKTLDHLCILFWSICFVVFIHVYFSSILRNCYASAHFFFRLVVSHELWFVRLICFPIHINNLLKDFSN